MSAWTDEDIAFTIDALLEINTSLKEGVRELTAIRTLLEESDERGDEEED